jgi:pilus assembly protein CpaE
MVWSSKGGVGKSTVACNIAGAVASMTRLRTCVIDLDIKAGHLGSRLGVFSPTIHELLSIHPLTAESVWQVLPRSEAANLWAVLGPKTSGNIAGVRQLLSPANYDSLFKILHEMFDVIVFDCPIGLEDPLVTKFALQRADSLMVVADGERVTVFGLRDALKSIMDTYSFPRERIGIVINQQVGKKIDVPRDEMLELLHGLPVLATIQDDRAAFVGAANQGALLINRVGDVGDDMRSIFGHVIQTLLPNVEVESHHVRGHDVSSSKRGKISGMFRHAKV